MPGSPIDYAVAFDHAGLVEHLLSCGADIDHRDVEGSTPLMTTTAYSSVESAAVLVRRGADQTAVDNKDMNILHYIAYLATTETMAFFLELAEAGELAGINITRETNEGMTPLQALNGRSDMSPEMRDVFDRLLAALAKTADGAARNVASNVSDDEEEVFYDANEDGDFDAQIKYR